MPVTVTVHRVAHDCSNMPFRRGLGKAALFVSESHFTPVMRHLCVQRPELWLNYPPNRRSAILNPIAARLA